MAANQMGPVTLRTAVWADHGKLEQLQWRASLANPGDREALLAHPEVNELAPAHIADGRVFVAELADTVLGFAAIVPRPDGSFELDALFVEPDHWRRGIGRLLLDHCCHAARLAGAAELHVMGNPHARRFYEASQFEMLGTTPLRFGVGLLMKRVLSPGPAR